MTAAPAYDAVVVGGGPVGQFFSLAAAQFGARVLLLESKSSDATLQDERTLALSWHTWLLLQRIGAVPRLSAHVTPITSIHVSQRGQFGRSTLDAGEAGIAALGYVASYAALQRALMHGINSSVQTQYDATATEVRDRGECVSVSYQNTTVDARFAFIAEGGGPLLERLGFSVEEKSYGVNAVVALVSADRTQNGVAYERFTSLGPIALLPRENRYALVWTATAEQSQSLVAADDEKFLAQLQLAFGWRAGKFVTTTPRGQYPLVLKQVRDRVRGNIALIGNAAQTLHPVAGQGLNLGLRDAWVAAANMKKMLQVSGTSLKNFSSMQQVDRDRTIFFTDGLARAFTKSWPGIGIVRALGLETLDISPIARRAFARAMSIGINL